MFAPLRLFPPIQPNQPPRPTPLYRRFLFLPTLLAFLCLSGCQSVLKTQAPASETTPPQVPGQEATQQAAQPTQKQTPAKPLPSPGTQSQKTASKPSPSPTSPGQDITAEPIPESWLVAVQQVQEGDRIIVKRQGQELTVRLCGIDAPALTQTAGQKSRDYLQLLLDKGSTTGLIRIDPVQQEGSDRPTVVAELFVVKTGGAEIFVNQALVEAGLARHSQRAHLTCPNDTKLVKAETVAKENQFGVWRESQSVSLGNARPSRS